MPVTPRPWGAGRGEERGAGGRWGAGGVAGSDNKLGAKGVMELAAALHGLEHLHTLVLRPTMTSISIYHKDATVSNLRSVEW